MHKFARRMQPPPFLNLNLETRSFYFQILFIRLGAAVGIFLYADFK